MAASDTKEVFISYSTKNKEQAEFFCSQLEGKGIYCWLAPRDIPSGGKWASAITDGIAQAQVMALLISEASVASEEVEKELDLANGQRKIIIPVRIENATLKGAFLYHLSNKQWVDALDEDKQVRFKAAIDFLFSKLNKKPIRYSGSIHERARRLVDTLNKEHNKQLNDMNALFSLREEEQDKIKLIFPLRFGATGLDLIFGFDGKNKTMEIYADAPTDGDPLSGPFYNGILVKNFNDYFPLKSWKGRRWKSISLLPETNLETHLASSSSGFGIFEENVIAFSETVLPKVFQWAGYIKQVKDAIVGLEEQLKAIFPENEGWRVGAPEGERLSELRENGRLIIYKQEWVPKDNYKGRGWLSIALESEHNFLNNLHFGIVKYEPWVTLNEYNVQLVDACNRLLGKTGKPYASWVWWQYLNEEWKCSGIREVESRWENKLEGFTSHCVEKLAPLKQLKDLITEVYEKASSQQIVNVDAIADVTAEEMGGWDSSLIIKSWFEKLAEDTERSIQKDYGYDDIKVEYRYRGEWLIDLYLRIKVENFDAAIAFRCGKSLLKTEALSLEPPDFESGIVIDFLKFKGVKISENSGTGKVDFGGESIPSWLEKYKHYVCEQVPQIIPAIKDMKEHLERIVALTCKIENEIRTVLTAADGWVVSNTARSLERYEPITIWKKSWLNEGASADELPPLVIQIIPESCCFDELAIIVRNMASPIPALEQKFGAIYGACEVLFGKSEKGDASELWRKRLEEPFRKIGGMYPVIDVRDEEKNREVVEYFSGISRKIQQLEYLISDACKARNEIKF